MPTLLLLLPYPFSPRWSRGASTRIRIKMERTGFVHVKSNTQEVGVSKPLASAIKGKEGASQRRRCVGKYAQWITHKGERILFVNVAGLREAEYIAALEELKQALLG